MRILLFVAFILGISFSAQADAPDTLEVRLNLVKGPAAIDLFYATWTYSTSNPFIDRKNPVESIEIDDLPTFITEDYWPGTGWFSILLRSDSTVASHVLSLFMEWPGAAEFYLDKRWIFSKGRLGDRPEEELQVWSPMQTSLILTPGLHRLDVRFSYFHENDPAYYDQPRPFQLRLDLFEESQSYIHNSFSRFASHYLGLLFASLALLFFHVLLYLFDKQKTWRLFYALMVIAFALLAFSNFQIYRIQDHLQFDFYHALASYSFVLLGIAIHLFIYHVADQNLGKALFVGLLSGSITIIIVWMMKVSWPAYLLMFLVLLDGIRSTVQYASKTESMAWIIALSMMAALFLVGNRFLSGLGLVLFEWQEFNILNTVYACGSVVLTSAVFLAHDIGKTSRSLEQKILDIRHLSRRSLDQEMKRVKLEFEAEKEHAAAIENQLRAEAAELQLKIEESENKRKTKELEDARQLQLSMLPRTVPEIEGLDIAVHMETASEVGGDYYDFFRESDHQLTFAFGDATGHGIKAGTLVTAVKALFQVTARRANIIDLFREYTRVIKSMHLGILYITLIVGKFTRNLNGFRFYWSSSGMPPVIYYSKREGRCKEITIKGMPIGTVADFPYETAQLEMESGDMLVFLSDGYSEMFSEDGEQLGIEDAVSILCTHHSLKADQLMARLIDLGKKWRGDEPLHDDVSAVIFKVR